MFSRDMVGGLVAISTGSLYLFFTYNLRSSYLADSVGPAGIPKVLGILMILCGIGLCLQATWKYIKTEKPVHTGWAGQGEKILRASGLLCLGIAYLAVINTSGYIISIAMLLAAVALYQGASLSWRVPVIAGSGAIILWAVFVQLLGVSMPSGFL